MNVTNSKKILATVALVFTITAAPTTAFARASVHLDLPGLSINLHDRIFDRHHRKLRKHYRKHGKRYYNRHYRSRDYDYRPRHSSRYYDDYYYEDYRPYRSRSRRNSNLCPTPGYSDRYYRNSGCYDHGDHYHCDG